MKATPLKIGALALLCALPLCPLLATPQSPSAPMAQQPASPAEVDAQAEALLKNAETRLKGISHISAVVIEDNTLPVTEKRKQEVVRRWETTTTLGKPGYALTKAREGTRSKTDPTHFEMRTGAEVTTDGKATWAYLVPLKQYMPMPKNRYSLDSEFGARFQWAFRPLDGFFNPQVSVWSAVKALRKQGRLQMLSPVRKETWNGAAYSVVDLAYRTDSDYALDEQKKTGVFPATQCSVYFGADGLVHRTKTVYPWNEVREYSLQNVRIDREKVDPAKFAFRKPEGATLRPEEPKMLAVGTVAPDFTVWNRENKPIKLSDFKGRVVVLDFMASWCGPCIASMPHLKAIQDAVKGQPVTMFTVGVWDERKAFNTWLDANEAKYPFTYAFDPSPQKAKGNIAYDLYQVPGIPGTYVIDKDGKIAAAIVGYSRGDTRLEAALRKVGVTVSLPAETTATEKPTTATVE